MRRLATGVRVLGVSVEEKVAGRGPVSSGWCCPGPLPVLVRPTLVLSGNCLRRSWMPLVCAVCAVAMGMHSE
jgi:hypothetical protein